jgi:hypothetical protein
LAFHWGREADHSPPSSAEIKEWVELYLHSPNMTPWRGAQLGGAQGTGRNNILLCHPTGPTEVINAFILVFSHIRRI